MKIIDTDLPALSSLKPHNQESSLGLAGLLVHAAAELDRDRASAKMLLAHASALLNAEIERRSPDYTSPFHGGLSGWQMQYVRVFIDEHITHSIRVEELGRVANLSTSQFSRAFKKSFGKTPHFYIVSQRLALACRLMLTEETPLSEVALACGFSDQAHLSKVFRQQTGRSPGAWRREQRQLQARLKDLTEPD